MALAADPEPVFGMFAPRICIGHRTCYFPTHMFAQLTSRLTPLCDISFIEIRGAFRA
jgi:hypothetical protein